MLTPNRCTYFILLLIVFSGGLTGCENTDLQLAAETGIDTYKAITLSDQTVTELSVQSSATMDSQHSISPADSTYAKRLQRLVGDLYERDGYTFEYKVFSKDDVNAFAMADGAIRIYSGPMGLLEDAELFFVIGHEMGHVVKQHSSKQLRLAYAASAVRKGIASQEGGAAQEG